MGALPLILLDTGLRPKILQNSPKNQGSGTGFTKANNVQ